MEGSGEQGEKNPTCALQSRPAGRTGTEEMGRETRRPPSHTGHST